MTLISSYAKGIYESAFLFKQLIALLIRKLNDCKEIFQGRHMSAMCLNRMYLLSSRNIDRDLGGLTSTTEFSDQEWMRSLHNLDLIINIKVLIYEFRFFEKNKCVRTVLNIQFC